MTSHENFLSNAETCRRALSGALDRETLRTLISVPLFHVTGCNSQLLLAAYTGGTAVVIPAFEIGAFLRAISAERIDVMITVPAIYWLAISHRPSPPWTSPACARSPTAGRRSRRTWSRGWRRRSRRRGWATGSA